MSEWQGYEMKKKKEEIATKEAADAWNKDDAQAVLNNW
jgi:hypothetical protein